MRLTKTAEFIIRQAKKEFILPTRTEIAENPFSVEYRKGVLGITGLMLYTYAGYSRKAIAKMFKKTKTTIRNYTIFVQNLNETEHKNLVIAKKNMIANIENYLKYKK